MTSSQTSSGLWIFTEPGSPDHTLDAFPCIFWSMAFPWQMQNGMKMYLPQWIETFWEIKPHQPFDQDTALYIEPRKEKPNPGLEQDKKSDQTAPPTAGASHVQELGFRRMEAAWWCRGFWFIYRLPKLGMRLQRTSPEERSVGPGVLSSPPLLLFSSSPSFLLPSFHSFRVFPAFLFSLLEAEYLAQWFFWYFDFKNQIINH